MMYKKPTRTFWASVLAALLIGIGLGRCALSPPADHSEHQPDSAPNMEDNAGQDEPSTWTCSMHPQIQESEPGDCPICGMDLIPAEEDSDQNGETRQMSMSEASRAMAEIQTTEVVEDYPETAVRMVGKLDYDETREKSLTARFPARVEELFVNYTGMRVRKDEHLGIVYSPDLLSAQRELITAYEADPESSLTRAARAKLRLWDLLPEQIEAIIETGEAKDRFVLKAPVSGIVVRKNIRQGDYVETGQPLFKIADLSVLWANLAAYESDLPWLRYGQQVTFTVESFPGEKFRGQIAFIAPQVDRTTRTIPIRVNVPNPEGRLKPGMFVRATVAARIARDGQVYAPAFAGKWISPMHPEVVKDEPGQCDVCGMDLVPAEELGYVRDETAPAPLIVPSSAVLRTGKRAVVYVEKQGAEQPTYQGREVVLGPRANRHYIITSGLEAGQQVVTNGAFKIDSALQIQAKPSMMNPPENQPETSPNQQATDGDEANLDSHGSHTEEESPDSLTIPSDKAASIIEPYLALQAALAEDDLATAKAKTEAIMEKTGHTGPLPQLLHQMLDADSLEAIRMPHFQKLSNAIIAAAQADPDAFPTPLFLMHCPMADDDDGADWLQNAQPLQNPYFGASMLQCGEIQEKIGE